MKRFFNKVIATACCITLAAGTVTFTAQKDVKAEGETGTVTPVSNVRAAGALGSMNVSWMPELDTVKAINEGKSVSFYAYLDDGTEPVKIIDNLNDIYVTRKGIRVQAESNNSGWYGEGHNDQYDMGITALTGAQNNRTVKFDSVQMPEDGAYQVTARYSTASEGVSTKTPRIKMYVDSDWDDAQWNKELTLPLTKIQQWGYYEEETFTLNQMFEGNHKIALTFLSINNNYVANLDWIEFSRPVYNVKLTGIPSGAHTVSIKASVDGVLSDSAVSNSATVSDMPGCKTSADVTVEGFQIRTNDAENIPIGFRTMCKAPAVGESVIADGTMYKVAKIGTIYSLDMNNTSGNHNYDFIDSGYTILKDSPEAGADYYTGKNNAVYNGNSYVCTYGYVATDAGITETKDGYSTYWRTIGDGENDVNTMKAMIPYSILVRAFVVAEDGTIIYSQDTASVSILETAHYLYTHSLAANWIGHVYLYNSILRHYDYSYGNSLYIDSYTKQEYGWNDNLYTPTN